MLERHRSADTRHWVLAAGHAGNCLEGWRIRACYREREAADSERNRLETGTGREPAAIVSGTGSEAREECIRRNERMFAERARTAWPPGAPHPPAGL